MPAASTATTSQAENNLLRWQARLSTYEARLRHRQAEARQLFPGDEQRQQAHCQTEAARVRLAAGSVEQAQQEVTGPGPATPARVAAAQQTWWGRLLARLRGR